MNEQKICPVCGTEIPADADTYPVCGMDDLNRIFLDEESYDRWVETKLKPYASRYRHNHNKAVATGGSQEDVFPLKYDPYSRIQPVIATGAYHTLGVKKDGTVIVAGSSRYGQCNVNNWQDIVTIVTGSSRTVGLKKDGTVVAVGREERYRCENPCAVSDWRDIVSIATATEGGHTVGLKKDGTVVAVGMNNVGQCEVDNWRDIW